MILVDLPLRLSNWTNDKNFLAMALREAALNAAENTIVNFQEKRHWSIKHLLNSQLGIHHANGKFCSPKKDMARPKN